MNPLATINDLPLNTIHEIMTHILDCTTLGTASLVSKAYSHAFQCELFRRTGVTIQLGAGESTTFLSTLVQPSHSQLLSHITSLHIRTPSPNLEPSIFDPFDEDTSRHCQVPSPAFFSELDAFLLAIPNLTRLTFQDVELSWSSLTSSERETLLETFAKLREVTFYSSSAKFTVPLSLLLHARQLNVLRISDMPAVHNQEETLFPGFLRNLPEPRFQACPIQTLSLDDIGLVARFSRFARRYNWDFFSKLQDLSIRFMDYGTSPHGIPSLVVSSFLKDFGISVQTLRLHVTRFRIFIGSSMDLNDLQSLLNLKHLEVVLQLDDADQSTDVRSFPDTWLFPVLQSLPSRRSISYLDITYQLFISGSSDSLFAPYSLSLCPLWVLLDHEFIQWTALEHLTLYVDFYQRGTLAGTRQKYGSGQTPITEPFLCLPQAARDNIIAMFRFIAPGIPV